MRVPLVVLALVAAPILTATAQEPDKLSRRLQPGLVNAEKCETADANRSPQSWSHENGSEKGKSAERGRKGDYRRGCSPQAPVPEPSLPPPPPPPPPTPAGTAAITGVVYEDVTDQPYLSGWTIELSGTMTATALTNGSGTYRFSDLPAGSYIVCQRLQPGWIQTRPVTGPQCPTGVGHSFSVLEGRTAYFVNFANVRQ